MKTHTRRLSTSAAAAVLAAVLAIGGLTGRLEAQTPSATPAPCPTGVALTVAPPSAAAPTTVTVSLPPEVVIKSPAEGDPNSYHVHYFVDVPAVEEGTSIPTGDPQIIHSISLTQDLGALEPGPHTVTVVLGQFNHAACSVRGNTSFTVAEAAVPKPPQAGSGPTDRRDDGGDSLVGPLALAGGVVALLLAGTFARRRRGAVR